MHMRLWLCLLLMFASAIGLPDRRALEHLAKPQALERKDVARETPRDKCASSIAQKAAAEAKAAQAAQNAAGAQAAHMVR